MKPPAFLIFTFVATVSSCKPRVPAPSPGNFAPSDRGLESVAEFGSIEDERQRGVALFLEAGKVISHPRCVNCHPAGERPLQGEEGAPHQPLVVGVHEGQGAAGLPCTTCHGEENFRNVPGNPKWHLAPREMAWEGLTLSEICEQLKDKTRNGGKSLSEIAEHMARDQLVAYGWEPPSHLEAVPGNQMLFGQLIAAWVDAGAPCPAARSGSESGSSSP